MANYRNTQRARARRECDPQFARMVMFSGVYAAQEAQEQWWDLQDLDAAALVAEWLPEWMARVAPGGRGRGPNGLRGFCARKTEILVEALH